jgi:probable F420-dependent oxidoreductase
MKIDGPLLATDLAAVAGEAGELERLGYDGAFTFEGAHDPFFPLLLAAEHTRRLELATAIAIALPRSPMQLANVAHDLQVFSKGRFILGLGSQIKPHIEKRFSAVWTKPCARMRELVLALRAIWRAFNESEKLDFRGEFYRHTLLTPFFNPGPSPYGAPRVFLGAVGAAMTRVAGEVADGLFVHPLNSPEFLRTTTLPALAEGFARRADRTGDRPPSFEIACQALVITGFDEDAIRQAQTMTRMQLAFYGSTPQYRCVLDAHGWGALQAELNALSKQGRWMEMSELVDDRMLDAFAIRCEPGQLASRLHERYGGLADRVAILCHSQPHLTHRAAWADVLAQCRRTTLQGGTDGIFG